MWNLKKNKTSPPKKQNKKKRDRDPTTSSWTQRRVCRLPEVPGGWEEKWVEGSKVKR